MSTQTIATKFRESSSSAGASSPNSFHRHLDSFLFQPSHPGSKSGDQIKDEEGNEEEEENPLTFSSSGEKVDDGKEILREEEDEEEGGEIPDIFERSVDSCSVAAAPKCGRCSHSRNRSCSHALSMSFQGGLYFKQEDCIPAALDATTSILSDKHADLDNVEMIYLNRRSSSVMGLNMALGRPFAPSRKNSTYSMNGGLTGFNSLNQQQQSQLQQSSPPKLQSSQLAVNFLSYAEMVNGDEYLRRPSLSYGGKQAALLSFLPTLLTMQQSSTASFNNNYNNNNNAQSLASPPPAGFRLQRLNTGGLERSYLGNSQFLHLSKQIMKQQGKIKSGGYPKKNFLISPELSDNEDLVTDIHSGRQMSITSANLHRSNTSGFLDIKDDESFVSMSVGDCIRNIKSEIIG